VTGVVQRTATATKAAAVAGPNAPRGLSPVGSTCTATSPAIVTTIAASATHPAPTVIAIRCLAGGCGIEPLIGSADQNSLIITVPSWPSLFSKTPMAHTGPHPGEERDMDDMTFEELIEERREAWGTASSASGYSPAAEVPAGAAFDASQLDVLEDTMPLPAYRPERL